VGKVADEAARLIEALSGWAQTSPSAEPAEPSQPGASAESGETAQPGASGEQQAAAGSGEESRSNDEREEPGEQQGTCAQCGAPVRGHASPAVAAVCRVCPVCQGVGLLSTLRPETLDRLVDVASAALVGLRTLAEQARAASGAAQGMPAGHPVEDIPVEDIPVVDEDATARGRTADSRS
jgi:hypothetical protein